MSKENNFNLTTSFEKKSIDVILSEVKKVDTKKVSSEVLEWIICNVENFVDDNMKVFKIDLVLDATEGLCETRKLQDLYRAIPEDDGLSNFELEKIIECRKILDEVTNKVYGEMIKDKEQMDSLFNRLIFYYEKIIPNPENKIKANQIDIEIRELLSKKEAAKSKKTKDSIHKKILTKIDEGVKLLQFQKFDGKAAILKFEYEAFDLSVQIRDPKNKEVKKEYKIEEGFTLWIELSYAIKRRQTAMF